MIKKLKQRLLELTYLNNLSHLSSTLSSIEIIYEIYKKKRECDRFVLSNGHAGLALYVVLEHFYGVDAQELLTRHGIHPCLDIENHIISSTGSLGQGITVALGFAMAEPENDVYVLLSDGEIYEGSVYETFNVVDKYNIKNLNIYINCNSQSAIEKLDDNKTQRIVRALLPNHEKLFFCFSPELDLGITTGIESHYHKFKSEKEYEDAKNFL